MLIWLTSTSCTAWKILRYNASDVDDYRIFPQRLIAPSLNPRRFTPLSSSVSKSALDAELFNATRALIILREGKTVFEFYGEGHSRGSPSMYFSISKSIFALLLGIYMEENKTMSLETPIRQYIPELAPEFRNSLQIRHLLNMNSGVDYAESSNPFGIHTQMYYTNNIESLLVGLKKKENPGGRFLYKSADSQLLGLALHREFQGRTDLSTYLQEKLWQPAGMEYPAYWSLDRENGIEKVYCCIAGTAVDLARIGNLVLHRGKVNGYQVVPRHWIEQIFAAAKTRSVFFHNHWWISPDCQDCLWANGHLGQFLLINGTTRTIIVRLGTSMGNLNRAQWERRILNLSESDTYFSLD